MPFLLASFSIPGRKEGHWKGCMKSDLGNSRRFLAIKGVIMIVPGPLQGTEGRRVLTAMTTRSLGVPYTSAARYMQRPISNSFARATCIIAPIQVYSRENPQEFAHYNDIFMGGHTTHFLGSRSEWGKMVESLPLLHELQGLNVPIIARVHLPKRSRIIRVRKCKSGICEIRGEFTRFSALLCP
jgi:hypothetical protein